MKEICAAIDFHRFGERYRLDHNQPVAKKMETTKRLRKLLLFGLVSANVAVFAITGYSVFQTKRQFEDRAATLSQNVALAASQNITSSFEKIDLALSDIKWEIESSFDAEHRVIGDDFLRLLKRIENSLPEVEVFRVVDSQGMIVLGTGVRRGEHVRVADREYFEYYEKHDDNRLYISKPMVGRVIKKPLIILGRRLNYPDGHFAGVVYAIVTINYINGLLASFDLGTHGTITIRDSNLGLITRWPPLWDRPTGEFGNRQASPELQAQIKKGIDSGTLLNANSSDGENRTITFRRLAAFPLIVSAGVAPQDYLAALWGEGLYQDLTIAIGFAVLSLLVFYLSMRLLKQSDQSRRARDESLDRLQKIANRVPGVVYQFKMNADGTTCFPFSSGAMYDFFHLCPEELQRDAKPAFSLIHPEDINSVRHAMRQSASDMTPWVQEFRIRFADGSIRWLRGNSMPQTEADSSVIWYGYISDITEHKLEEKAVEAKAKNLAALLETASDGIHILDECGALIQFSRSFAAMLGYSDEEIRHFNVCDWDTQVPNDQIAERIQAVISTPTTFTTRHRKKDGTEIDVEINAKGVEIDGKKYLYASSRDVTERVRSAEQIKELLAEQSAILNSRIVGIVRLADRKVAWCNERFASFFGYTQGELLGQVVRVIYATEEEYKTFGKTAYRAIEKGEVVREQLKLCHKNGACGWYEVGGGRLRPDSTETIWALVDITERKALEEKIKAMAFFDVLTSLPNRRMLDDRLRQALAANQRSERFGAIMFIDLDNFKPLNDTAGHEAGDLLLMEVGKRLAGCMRQMDTVARVGGDEFVAMISSLEGDLLAAEGQAKIVAEKIRLAIAAPYVISMHHAGQTDVTIEHHCTASIGVVLFPQNDGEPEDYLKWADAAMYQAKEAGRNQIRFYSQ